MIDIIKPSIPAVQGASVAQKYVGFEDKLSAKDKPSLFTTTLFQALETDLTINLAAEAQTLSKSRSRISLPARWTFVLLPVVMTLGDWLLGRSKKIDANPITRTIHQGVHFLAKHVEKVIHVATAVSLVALLVLGQTAFAVTALTFLAIAALHHQGLLPPKVMAAAFYSVNLLAAASLLAMGHVVVAGGFVGYLTLEALGHYHLLPEVVNQHLVPSGPLLNNVSGVVLGAPLQKVFSLLNIAILIKSKIFFRHDAIPRLGLKELQKQSVTQDQMQKLLKFSREESLWEHTKLNSSHLSVDPDGTTSVESQIITRLQSERQKIYDTIYKFCMDELPGYEILALYLSPNKEIFSRILQESSATEQYGLPLPKNRLEGPITLETALVCKALQYSMNLTFNEGLYSEKSHIDIDGYNPQRIVKLIKKDPSLNQLLEKEWDKWVETHVGDDLDSIEIRRAYQNPEQIDACLVAILTEMGVLEIKP